MDQLFNLFLFLTAILIFVLLLIYNFIKDMIYSRKSTHRYNNKHRIEEFEDKLEEIEKSPESKAAKIALGKTYFDLYCVEFQGHELMLEEFLHRFRFFLKNVNEESRNVD